MLFNSIIFFLGGIGLFLFGMKFMSEGLELSTGSRLKKILGLFTANKYVGVLVGFIITAITQSSAVTTVMVIGFVNAGLLNLLQTAGIIIGANIGTTTTGLIIALNIHTVAPVCIFAGSVLILFTKKKKLKHIGMVIAGFGILFLGLKVMSDAMKPLSELPQVIELFKFTANPLLGFIIGLAITAITQSSTATIGIIVAVMSAGIITDMNQAIFILYGLNIGSCSPAIISSLGSSKNARKTAMIHLVYNVIGISIFAIVTLLPLGFVGIITSLSDNISKQFVYAHIIVNIIMAIILLPASKFIIRITEWIIKGVDEAKSDVYFEYIDEKSLETPSLAVVQTYKEVDRLAMMVVGNFALAKKIVLGQSKDAENDMLRISETENTVNFLRGKIKNHIIKLNATELEYIDVKVVASLSSVINDLERVGNHAVNIVKSVSQATENYGAFTDESISELESMMENASVALSRAVEIFANGEWDQKGTQEVKQLEEITDDQNERYKQNHIARLDKGQCDYVTGLAFVKILIDLERIADHSCNIAYSLYYKK